MESVPSTLQEAIIHFADAENCRTYMVNLRWSNGAIKCPRCGSDNVDWLPNAKLYKCYEKHAQQKFSLKVGTIFEDSPLPLEKWLPAVWMLTNCKNGVSSWELHRALGVTQKTAWFMQHRIRLAMQDEFLGGKMSGHIEVDETFIGAKSRNMHAKDRKRKLPGAGGLVGKAIVFGLLERGEDGGKVRTAVLPNVKKHQIQGEIKKHVEAGSHVYSDALLSYWGLNENYVHGIIDHATKYVDGQIHTNGLENFWSLLKRSIKGTYVSVEPFHLFRYLDEQAFRYNNRKPMNDAHRFSYVMRKTFGKRLTYAEVTGRRGKRPKFERIKNLPRGPKIKP